MKQILERDVENLAIVQRKSSSNSEARESTFKISFRGFEVKTLKITLVGAGESASEDHWVGV